MTLKKKKVESLKVCEALVNWVDAGDEASDYASSCNLGHIVNDARVVLAAYENSGVYGNNADNGDSADTVEVNEGKLEEVLRLLDVDCRLQGSCENCPELKLCSRFEQFQFPDYKRGVCTYLQSGEEAEDE